MAEQLPDGVKRNNVTADPNDFRIDIPGRRNNKSNSKENFAAVFKTDGDYDVYTIRTNILGIEVLGDPFYRYNAESDTETILDKRQYDIYMSGASGKKQKNELNRKTRTTIISTAEVLATGGDSVAITQRNELITKNGYKSLPNGANAAVEELKPEPEVRESDAETRDTNAGLVAEDGQTSTPITGNLSDLNIERREGTFGEKVSLQYPEYIPEGLNYDHIQISAYAYVPAGLGLEPTAAEDRYKNVEQSLGRVILPMQPNFSESNSVAWGGDMLNAIQSTLGGTASGLIEGIGNFSGQDLKAAVSNFFGDVGTIISDEQLGPFVAAYFAGQAVKANITGRTTGAVINPNLELLFNGPKLRTFNFSFKLTPRSATEAKTIREIIKFFKKNMAAQRSSSNLFLLSPNVFKLKYISGFDGEQNPYMNKIKPCALSAFNVNYTPDGSYMTYNDRNNPSMTSYDIGLSFSEIEPIYADEINYTTTDMSY